MDTEAQQKFLPSDELRHPLTTTTREDLSGPPAGPLAERQAEIEQVTAYLLADLYQNADHAAGAGLDRLTARNRALVSASNEEILRSLANQAQVLEALFHRYVLLAQAPNLQPHVVEAFMRIALAAERTYLRAVAVLTTVKSMSQGQAA